MADFLSQEEKRKKIAVNLLDLHDTFARDIVVYKEAKKVIINTDSNYNYLYGSSGKSTQRKKCSVKKYLKQE